MKGIILVSGFDARMLPCAKVINKHCPPAHDKPMIYYPLETLVRVEIKID